MKKYALVVGASGAIGSAIAKRLANDGWSLYLHFHHNQTKVENLIEELTEKYSLQEFLSVRADFSSSEGADLLSKQIYSIQAIVFAGGHAFYGLLEDTPVEEMDKLWRVHVQNPMRLLALLSSKLRANDISYVLFIGSIWGETGAAFETVYSAVKGAQHAFVKSYAKEVAYNHILVNAIAPGFIDTNMNQHLTDEEQQQLYEDIPLGRPGKIEDVANLVSFYFSGQANYITGQIIRINGGWYI
ncbi:MULTISPECIES: elongation factor P 5-aminopentanone reductase [Lysinibacillus]|uniref:SDR family oxidoreductase n=1 Tax=Lysinibacillus antri TaxID=2498145 RepID=A0A3S0P5I1_9BACI|nr:MULTISPECIES: SDR family oxidoreductase [Lysinibacillus]RUL55192.1 SDR family oxidoreductase [Lysinibacillus antri]TSI11345.1 SDR family oxidoreductase [Lysinibacillus sp. BW-2-10]